MCGDVSFTYLLCEVELVEVVVVVDGGPQTLVVLLGDRQLVQSLVHHRQIVLLHTVRWVM